MEPLVGLRNLLKEMAYKEGRERAGVAPDGLQAVEVK